MVSIFKFPEGLPFSCWLPALLLHWHWLLNPSAVRSTRLATCLSPCLCPVRTDCSLPGSSDHHGTKQKRELPDGITHLPETSFIVYSRDFQGASWTNDSWFKYRFLGPRPTKSETRGVGPPVWVFSSLAGDSDADTHGAVVASQASNENDSLTWRITHDSDLGCTVLPAGTFFCACV